MQVVRSWTRAARSARRPRATGARHRVAAVTMLVAIGVVSGCGAVVDEEPDPAGSAGTDAPGEDVPGAAPDQDDLADESGPTDDAGGTQDQTGAQDEAHEAAEREAEGPAVDPAEVGADELGQVPVLMYHQLVEGGGGDYDLTADEFRTELQWLFDNDYRPITTTQLVRGEIDVPPGTTPVVLTFDDSTRSQAALTEDGELDPQTALGILVEVAANYDDVEPRASVYVISGSLFGEAGDQEQILVTLHELGMELGNHTHTHPNLANVDAATVQDELAENVATVTSIVPDAEVVTLALPLGVFPEDRDLVAAGRGAAGTYEHEGVLLVGSNPSPSPYSAEFDAFAIPRIRTSPSWDGGEPDFGSAFWFEQLESDGGSYRRFVSDGDPSTISFPAQYEQDLAPTFADRANPY